MTLRAPPFPSPRDPELIALYVLRWKNDRPWTATRMKGYVAFVVANGGIWNPGFMPTPEIIRARTKTDPAVTRLINAGIIRRSPKYPHHLTLGIP